MIRLPDDDLRWTPRGARLHFDVPAAGEIIGFAHEVWRIVEIRPLPKDRWGDAEHHYARAFKDRRQPQAVRIRPLRLADHPDPVAARAEDRHLNAVAVRSWYVFENEHYPVCAACLEPMPCREETGRHLAEQAVAKMGRYETAGLCPACQEPITRRQKSLTFPDNLEVPGGPPVTFHTRGRCHWAAAEYEKRWVAADPERRRHTLSCPGHITNHNDGTYDCTQLGDCPGPIARHPSYQRCRCPGLRAAPAHLPLVRFVANVGVRTRLLRRPDDRAPRTDGVGHGDRGHLGALGEGGPTVSATLYALIGPPGAGKTSLRPCFPDAVVVSLDDLRGQWSCCPMNQNRELLSRVLVFARPTARAALSDGRDVVWDATSARAGHRCELVALAHARGARAVGVLVLPPLDVVLARNAIRDATPCDTCGYARRVPEDVVRAMHDAITGDLHALGGEGWDEIREAPGPLRCHGMDCCWECFAGRPSHELLATCGCDEAVGLAAPR